MALNEKKFSGAIHGDPEHKNIYSPEIGAFFPVKWLIVSNTSQSIGALTNCHHDHRS